MEKAHKSGLMELSMREHGSRIKPTVRVSSGMQMEIFMMVNGKMIKPTAKASICMLMELDTKETGKMTCKMVGVLRAGQTVLNTKANTKKE